MSEPTKEIRYKVPASWKRELQVAAKSMGLTLSGLQRLRDRDFLRNRYSEQEQETLSK